MKLFILQYIHTVVFWSHQPSLLETKGLSLKGHACYGKTYSLICTIEYVDMNMNYAQTHLNYAFNV